jgi:hypothetical protein
LLLSKSKSASLISIILLDMVVMSFFHEANNSSSVRIIDT